MTNSNIQSKDSEWNIWNEYVDDEEEDNDYDHVVDDTKRTTRSTTTTATRTTTTTRTTSVGLWNQPLPRNLHRKNALGSAPREWDEELLSQQDVLTQQSLLQWSLRNDVSQWNPSVQRILLYHNVRNDTVDTSDGPSLTRFHSQISQKQVLTTPHQQDKTPASRSLVLPIDTQITDQPTAQSKRTICATNSSIPSSMNLSSTFTTDPVTAIQSKPPVVSNENHVTTSNQSTIATEVITAIGLTTDRRRYMQEQIRVEPETTIDSATNQPPLSSLSSFASVSLPPWSTGDAAISTQPDSNMMNDDDSHSTMTLVSNAMDTSRSSCTNIHKIDKIQNNDLVKPAFLTTTNTEVPTVTVAHDNQNTADSIMPSPNPHLISSLPHQPQLLIPSAPTATTATSNTINTTATYNNDPETDWFRQGIANDKPFVPQTTQPIQTVFGSFNESNETTNNCTSTSRTQSCSPSNTTMTMGSGSTSKLQPIGTPSMAANHSSHQSNPSLIPLRQPVDSVSMVDASFLVGDCSTPSFLFPVDGGKHSGPVKINDINNINNINNVIHSSSSIHSHSSVHSNTNSTCHSQAEKTTGTFLCSSFFNGNMSPQPHLQPQQSDATNPWGFSTGFVPTYLPLTSSTSSTSSTKLSSTPQVVLGGTNDDINDDQGKSLEESLMSLCNEVGNGFENTSQQSQQPKKKKKKKAKVSTTTSIATMSSTTTSSSSSSCGIVVEGGLNTGECSSMPTTSLANPMLSNHNIPPETTTITSPTTFVTGTSSIISATSACLSLMTPKAALHVVYGKEPRRKVISGEYFHTFHDSGAAHSLRWTSIFVCPITAELFLAVPYPGSGGFSTSHTAPATDETVDPRWGRYWFTKKVHAEHASAASAHDCIVYRDQMKNIALQLQQSLSSSAFIGIEAPYPQSKGLYEVPLVYYIPDAVRESIRQQQEQIRNMTTFGGFRGS